MWIAHSVAQVRSAEEPLLAAGADLMGQAAFALATHVLRILGDRRGGVAGTRVVILVGSGNNGGDGLHAGAHLVRRGVDVTAVLTSERPHPGGLAAFERAGGRVIWLAGPNRAWVGDGVAAAFTADVVLDALLGIGATGALHSSAADLVVPLADLLEADDGPDRPLVVAVDTPSGIGVDDGTLPGPVLPADVTVSFGSVKPGLLVPPAALVAGRVVPVELGLVLPDEVAVRRLESADVGAFWPVPEAMDHKYTRGVVGVVAGTDLFPGAAVLATSAAVRTGAGMVRFLGGDAVAAQVLASRPEAVRADGQVQAWVVGPGVGTGDAEQVKRVTDVLRRATVPVVVDAGALAILPAVLPELSVEQRALMLLTPHAGELADLLTALGVEYRREQVLAAPLAAVRQVVDLVGGTVLLKGAVSLVASPTGTVFAQADGTPWLATAGTGDVLAGLIGGLLAQLRGRTVAGRPGTGQVSPAEAGAAAVLVHGRAARLATEAVGGGPIAALDVAACIPSAIGALLVG